MNKRLFFRLLSLAGAGLLLTACERAASPSGDAQASAPAHAAQAWPRSFDTPRGKFTLQAPPKRIVSTSITLSGSLLAIDAPLYGTAAGRANTSVEDEQGFFRQWGALAKARKVVPLYHGEPSAEAIVAAHPDLILIAATGGDSALNLYEQLSQVAPTLVVNYDDKNWQQLAQFLGRVTGQEARAGQIVAEFEQSLASVKRNIRLPPQPVNALVYFPDGSGGILWTRESAQGRLLQDLGFTLASIPDSVKGNNSRGLRKDIVQIGGEKFADGILGQTVLLFSAEPEREASLKQDRFLAGQPAVKAGRVYAVGNDTFRIDYFSARNLLQRLEQRFGGAS